MGLICIMCVAAALVLVWRWRGGRSLPPGPWGAPLLGYLPWLDPRAPHRTLEQLARRFGPVYGLRLGAVYTVVLSCPRVVRRVLSLPEASGRAPLFLTHGIMHGYGLICAEGERWREQRRFVCSCMRSFGAVRASLNRHNMEALIMDHVADFVHHVENQGNRVVLDPLLPLRHSLGSAMNVLVFGRSWPRTDNTWLWLQELQEEGTKHIGVAGPLNFLPFLRFVPKFARTMKFLLDGKVKTHKIYQKIIAERQMMLNASSLDGVKPLNFIDAFLLEREKKKGSHVEVFYSDEQFHHLLADLFGAGLDTTLTTLRWYLLYLAANPAVQAKVKAQLDAELGGAPPALGDLPALPYVEASLAEAQRIRSVVPVGIPHGALADIAVGGFVIPKGSMIVPLQWAMHMNPDDFPEPEAFRPERFLDEEGRFCRPAAFIPFQTGARMCVGDELARMLLFLFGASIVQKFHLKLDPLQPVDLEGECGITLTPKPHKLIFEKIQSYVV